MKDLAERARARQLRADGKPFRHIAAEVGVSLNSAYRWTRDIRLTPAQQERNLRGPAYRSLFFARPLLEEGRWLTVCVRTELSGRPEMDAAVN